MLDYLEHGGSGDCRALMVWLHGLGADGHDLEPVADMLGLSGVRHVFPHAPMRPVTINGGMSMRAWFDIAAPDLRVQEDSTGMLASAGRVAELVRALRRDAAMPVVLGGFSQGAVISLVAAACGVPGLAGLVAMSGYVPRFLQPALPGLRGKSVMMAHGEQDEVIPFALGKAGCETLVQAGLAVDWHAYTMPHTICREEVADLAAWLKRLLAAG
ncbi:MAG: carboxylesterase [Pseudomonadota bacterium]